MKTKYSMFGILAAIFLVVSFVVPGNLATPTPASADAGVCKWNYIDMPGSVIGTNRLAYDLGGVFPVGSEVVQLVPTAGGEVLAFVNVATDFDGDGIPDSGRIGVYSSGMKGILWSSPCAMHLQAAMTRVGYAVYNRDAFFGAASPDEATVWVAVTGGYVNGVNYDYPCNAWVTLNGGGSWTNTQLDAATITAGGGAPLPIGAIDISPVYAGKRDIIAGARTGSNAGTAMPLWVVQSGGYTGWLAQTIGPIPQLNDTPQGPVTACDILDLEISDTYVGDAAVGVLFATANGTFYNVALRDLSTTNQIVGWAYPSQSIEVTVGLPQTSPTAANIVVGDLEQPVDFSGQSASLRRAYISTDDGGAGANTGIYRIDDTTVYQLMNTTTNTGWWSKRIHSIAYYGTYASGKLLAGEAVGDACTAFVPTWFTDSPTVCPVPCWYPCLKCPTGAAANCCGVDEEGRNEGNADVIWSSDGTLAYAGTSSWGIVPGVDYPFDPAPDTWLADGWFRFLDYCPVQFDETAISVSRNNGETWNQIGFIDTYIDRFTDMAITADCTTIYASSNNPLPYCYGFDSVWRTTLTDTIAAPFPTMFPLGFFWERVLTHPNGLYNRPLECLWDVDPFAVAYCEAMGDGCCMWDDYEIPDPYCMGPEDCYWEKEPDFCCNEEQSAVGLLRLPPPGPNCDNGMVVGWAAWHTKAMMWSPDYGDYWAMIMPRYVVQDFAFESPTKLYTVDPTGIVQVMPFTGTAWSSAEEDSNTDLASAHTITVQPEGKVLVGAGALSAGMLYPAAMSIDGAETWTPVFDQLPTHGNIHGAIHPMFDSNKTFYLADDGLGNGTVYRLQFPSFVGVSAQDADIMAAVNGAAGCFAPNPVGQYGIQIAFTGPPDLGPALYTAPCNLGVDRTIFPLAGMPKPGMVWDNLPVDEPGNYADGVTFTAEPWSLKICGCCTMDTNTKLWAIDYRHYVPLPGFGGHAELQGFIWGFEDCFAKKGPALITEDGMLVGCDPVSGRAQEVNLCWEQLCVAVGYDLEIAKDEAFTLRVIDLASMPGCYSYRPVDVLKPCVFFPAGGQVVDIALTSSLEAAGGMDVLGGGGQITVTETTAVYDNTTGTMTVTTTTETVSGYDVYGEGGYGLYADQEFSMGPAGSAIALAGNLECGHKYYWRVMARECATGYILHSPWSEIRSFTIKAGLPVRADYYGLKLLSPDNGCLGCPVSPASFSWSPFKETTKYKFVLAKDAAMTQVVAEAEVPTTAYEYDGTLDYSTNYFWRVMSLEPAPSDWSATFSFQTEPAPAPPPAPEEAPGTPMWVWVIIAIGAILVIVTLVLIFKTRRA